MDDDLLALARQHVMSGRRIVERQRRIVANKKTLGLDTATSEALLRSFERSLVIFEQDLQAAMKTQGCGGAKVDAKADAVITAA